MQRWQPITFALALAPLLWGFTAAGQEPQEGIPRGAQAILIRNPDTAPGAPPYALTDQFGKVRRLIEPTPTLDLTPHVGQRVRIKHDTGSVLLASQLELPLAAPAREPREPRELRQVSAAQFVAPRRPAARDARAPDPQDRRYVVVPAQATDDPNGAFGEFLDNLPGPAAEDTPTPATDPIQLDDLPPPGRRESLEPTPANNDYYEEIPSVEPMQSGSISHQHAADCPHCNKHASPPPVATHGEDCPKCRAKVAPRVDLCSTCGRSEGWCGPTCNPPSRRGFYGRAEYLLWWFDSMNTPPLATVSDTPPPILGQPGTRVAFGGELLDDARSGLRLTIGAWLDNRRDVAIEFDWLGFDTETAGFNASDRFGTNTVGRPFYNVGPIDQNGNLLAPQDDVQIIPGGDLSIAARSRFQSAGLRLRTGLCCRDIGGGCGPCGCGDCVSGVGSRRGSGGISRVDFIAGYRFADLEEELVFREAGLSQGTPVATVGVNEAFRVDNDFHGLDLGFVYDWQSRRWGLELTSRIALGSTRQTVSINGSNTVAVGLASSVTTPGGLLTQPSNIGVYQQDRFSVLPELSARLSYRITPRLSLSGAYSLLYWANVVRPGDQIDLSVDGRQSGGIAPTSAFAHPRVDIEETGLWAHGFNFGLDYQY